MSRHCDTTQFTLMHHMVNKPFLLLGLAAEYRSRPRRRWCANNIAADHQMFITLTGQLSWQHLRQSDLYSKAKKSLFEPPFRALRGNVRTPSMARWKVRGRLYIRRNWTFFVISYGWDVMSGNRSKSAFFEGGGSLWTQISEGRERRRPSNRVIALSCGIKISVVRHLVLSQCTRVTDGQTDGLMDGQTDRITTPKTALAYARVVKVN